MVDAVPLRCCSGSATASSPSVTPSSPSLDPLKFDSLVAATYFKNPLVGLGEHHFAKGRFTEKLSEDEFLVDLSDVHLSPIAEVSSRVYVKVGGTSPSSGRIIGGVIAKVNSNGTLGVLLDNNVFESQLSQENVYLVKGRSRFTLGKEYEEVLSWVRDAGVRRRADQERISAVLYHRGWRIDRLYLLEGADVHCMSYVKKSVRMCVMDKAEWQRIHHAEMRILLLEKVRERAPRYFIQKYSGFVSANWAGLGVLSVFLWQFKNYRKSQRSFQLKHAVKTVLDSDEELPSDQISAGKFVDRPDEESWARHIVRHLDLSRPRVAVITGSRGCGKTTLLKSSIQKEGKKAIFVEIRGADDALSCILRSLKVPNVDACADPLDFITDTFRSVAKKTGEPPILVLILREGSQLSRVYNETVVLSCDRKLCHLVLEVSVEDLTHANLLLPRTDFYRVPNFNAHQAMQYTQHRVDPLSMHHFLQNAGTNTDDIEDLLSNIYHRNTSVTEHTNYKLCKAMRHIQSALDTKNGRELRKALLDLAKEDYENGVQVSKANPMLSDPSLKELVHYDPLLDRWIFTRHILHTAARCML